MGLGLQLLKKGLEELKAPRDRNFPETAMMTTPMLSERPKRG